MVADTLRHSKLSFEGMSDPIMLFATSLLKIHKKFHKIFNRPICPRTKRKSVSEY